MAVRIVDAATMPRQPLRVMLYGQTRVGKTTWAASAPRPIFLSVGIEGGDKTLRAFPGVKVAQIYTSAEMTETVDHIARNPDICETVVVDSITFYQDLLQSEIILKNRGPMRLQDWGLLDNAIMKTLLPKLHKLPQHVIWIALEMSTDDKSTGSVAQVGPMMSGKQSQKLPATTDMIMRMARQPTKCPDGLMRDVAVLQVTPQMTPQGPIMAGGRFGHAFPEGWIWPTWDHLMERIGGSVDLRPGQVGSAPPPGAVPPLNAQPILQAPQMGQAVQQQIVQGSSPQQPAPAWNGAR